MAETPMTIRVTRTVEFSSAHRLYREDLSDSENLEIFGLCANPNGHGHNYQLEDTVEGPLDPQSQMVVHFNQLKSLLEETVSLPLDHKNLNLDVPFLKGKIPTSEVLCVELWKEISRNIPSSVPWRLKRLRLGASTKNWVEYEGPNQ